MFSWLLSAAKVSRKVVMPKERISSASSDVHCRFCGHDSDSFSSLILLLGYICFDRHCFQLTTLSPTTQATKPMMSRMRASEIGSEPVAMAYRTVKAAPMPTQTA